MDQQQTKSWLIRGGAVVAGIGILAIALPAIYFAFLSALGLLGIGITAVIGIAAFKALPFLAQKWENKLLGLRIAEARQNPIEQIQNNILRKAQQLTAFSTALQNISGQIQALEDSLTARKKKYPNKDYSAQDIAIEKMREYYKKRVVKFKSAQLAHEEYKEAFDDAKFKYSFGNAAQGVAQAMNDADATTIVENMLADESFNAINVKYNAAFAELDIDSMELNTQDKLTFGDGVVIDVKAIEIPTLQIPNLQKVRA